jgi:hypothetical protein
LWVLQAKEGEEKSQKKEEINFKGRDSRGISPLFLSLF